MKEIIKQFIIGGTITAFFYFILSEKTKEDNDVSKFGFIYGAPIIFTYLAMLTFKLRGAKSVAQFSKHTIIGMITSLILISSWFFVETMGFNAILTFNILFTILLYSFYFYFELYNL